PRPSTCPSARSDPG
ncbi:sigma-70 region 2, partial [Streptomyces ipomoeae 91-03]